MNSKIIYKIYWDRIWIHFFIKGTGITDKLYLTNIGNTFKAELIHANPEYDLADDEYILNITNPGNCRMLPEGIYQIVSSDGYALSLSDAVDAGRFNRRFVYFHNEREYRVQFSGRNGFKIKASDIPCEGLGMLRKISSMIRRFRHNLAKSVLRSVYNVEYLLFHRKGHKDIHKVKSPRILLMSDQSEEMGSNMMALKNALIKKGYKPDECLRAVTTKHYSVIHWIKSLKKIARADYIFLDDHSQTTDWLTIRGAIITQLWHAGAGFKSTGYSRFGMPASPAPKSGHRQYDYGIAGSRKIRHFFSEVWGINDSMVLPTGMPRLDEYLDEDYINHTASDLLDKYPVLNSDSTDTSWKNRKRDNIILFAPTYRGENKKHAYYPYDKLDMDKLYKTCLDTDSFIIFKMHPFVEEPVPIPEAYKDRMLDLTTHPNINDLFYITDLLITDYSSNIYEFSLMRKPMLFYAFDIDEYTKERGFHRSYRGNVPGKIAETFDDMINSIYHKDFEYSKVEEYISNNFEHIDTHACDRIISQIIK